MRFVQVGEGQVEKFVFLHVLRFYCLQRKSELLGL